MVPAPRERRDQSSSESLMLMCLRLTLAFLAFGCSSASSSDMSFSMKSNKSSSSCRHSTQPCQHAPLSSRSSNTCTDACAGSWPRTSELMTPARDRFAEEGRAGVGAPLFALASLRSASACSATTGGELPSARTNIDSCWEIAAPAAMRETDAYRVFKEIHVLPAMAPTQNGV